MTVDKFGHHYNQKYTSIALRGHVSRILGINIDNDNNIDIQNKKIKNLAPPSEGTDAVNQSYVHSQNQHLQEILKNGIFNECSNIREEISQLKKSQNEIFKNLSQHPFNSPALIHHID